MKKEYINRELSWLDFNYRVLEEAQDKNNKLFERLKFLAITASNLDEFFMVRVSGIKDQISAEFDKLDPSGLTPKQQLIKIHDKTQAMVNDMYNCLNKALVPQLKKENIHFLAYEELSDYQKEYIEDYFMDSIYPVLTPMAVDKSRPFPLILNKSLNIAVLLEDDKKEQSHTFATVQVPSILGRFVEIPSSNGENNYIRLEKIIEVYISDLFKGHKVLAMAPYRITRNADLGLDEEEAEDLLEAIEMSVKQRRWGDCVRLEIGNNADKRIIKILEEELEITKDEMFFISGPIDLTYLMKFSGLHQYQNLKNEPLKPIEVTEFKDIPMFEAISKGDILVHHPFESFSCVVDFVKKAADDPKVLAIKQTLYRVSGNSPIVKALEHAAENGKQVTVLVELKARFDEENNIIWAKRLEKAGCHVVYGLVGLKTHSKLTLVIRKEEMGIKRYVHMGTGNYNDITANIYTDLGLFTCDPHIGADASVIFNMLSGYSEPSEFYKLCIAPRGLRKRFVELIRREAANAKMGKKAKIVAKMNSLVDTEIIRELYNASEEGVQIELVVRGICCLRAGVIGLSENINVISIVDMYLEHSRIFYFYNDGEEEIYLSSADWMPRNLDRRVELLFPIENEALRKEIKDMLKIFLSDNVKARELLPDDSYRKASARGKKHIHAQLEMYEYTKNKTLKCENEEKEYKNDNQEIDVS